MNLNGAVENGSAARVQAMMNSNSAVDNSNGAPLKRPGGGMKWSEVCERVQQPDGSVRTSPRIKSGITSTVSPPRPRPASHGLGKIGRLNGSGGSLPTSCSNGGAPSSRSSRGGSSGKSSRSSSLDGSHKARDGDISSRCSSGCWENCSNSSKDSRPRTPLSITPSPSGIMSLLMQPDPIRIGHLDNTILTSLLEDETVHVSENKMEGHSIDEVAQDTAQPFPCLENQVNHVMAEPRPGPVSFKWDPYFRDVPRRNCDVKSEWSVEPLAKYLTRVVQQVDANIETHRLPTPEKLDAFVARLVANSHRLLKHAPKKIRQTLHGMLSNRFKRFWNFARNEKVRSTNPEELKSMLTCLVEALASEFGVSPDDVDDGSWVRLGQYAMSQEQQEAQTGHLHVPNAVHHQQHRILVTDPYGRSAV